MILVITGVAKVLSTIGMAKIMQIADRMYGCFLTGISLKKQIKHIPIKMIAEIQVRRSIFVCLFLALEVFILHPTYGQGSITNEEKALRISGQYTHIFENGAPPRTNKYHFITITASNRWEMSITNANMPEDWEIMRYDGTHIYTFGTQVGDMPKGTTNTYKIYAYVYSGNFYVPEAQDSVHPFFPWMVFYLTPQMIRKYERNSVIDIPPPWGKRYSLLDYGFKWKTRYAENDRIIQRIDVVRDSALDLKTDEDELRRASLNYPFNWSQQDHRLEALRSRKELPQGFVRATYECEDVQRTNDWLIPSTARFAEYWPNWRESNYPPRLVFQMALEVDAIIPIQNAATAEVAPPAQTSVSDYRYQATNSRTKFNHATYKLNAGDPFPSGSDPKLLAQANDWLRKGTAYEGLQSKRRKTLAGMLLILVSGWVVLWLTRKKNAK